MEAKFKTDMYVVLCKYDETANHYGISEHVWGQLQGVCKIECVESDYISISTPRTTCTWWVSKDAVAPLEMQDIVQYDIE